MDEKNARPSDTPTPRSEQRIENTIENMLPVPQDESYHDDDVREADPSDMDHDWDAVLPRPDTHAEPDEEVDATGEDLDTEENVETRTYTHGSSEPHSGESLREPVSEPMFTEPSDDDAINDESEFFASSWQTADAPEGDEVSQDAIPAPEAEVEAPQEPALYCPSCSRSTTGPEFCGHCGASLFPEEEPPVSNRLTGSLSRLSQPIIAWTQPDSLRLTLGAGLAIILIALLLNGGGIALILSSLFLPVTVVYWALRRSGDHRDSTVTLLGLGLIGTLIGAMLGWLGAAVTLASWFETGILNYGAIGYGGQFATRADAPSISVWLVVGLIIPVIAAVLLAILPFGLARALPDSRSAMVNLTRAATIGAGISAGATIVFVAPMLKMGGPALSASHWTIITIGLAIIRPLIWTFAGGAIGAAVGRYIGTKTLTGMLVPTILAAVLLFVLGFLTVQLMPLGLWAELILGLVIVVLAAFAYGRAMSAAITYDRRPITSWVAVDDAHEAPSEDEVVTEPIDEDTTPTRVE